MRVAYFLLLSLLLPTGACYSPDLDAKPFLCAPTGKECPDGFRCQGGSPKICVRESEIVDAGRGDAGPLTDALLEPSKEGPIFLDGSQVQPSNNCIDHSSEPNNTSGTAFELLSTGLITDWEICYPGDVDHYKIKVKQGQHVTVDVLFSHEKGDLEAALLDPDGFVVSDGRSADSNEKLELTSASKEGEYVIGVYGFGSAVNTYDLRITIN